MAELVCAENELSDRFPGRFKISYTDCLDGPLTKRSHQIVFWKNLENSFV